MSQKVNIPGEAQPHASVKPAAPDAGISHTHMATEGAPHEKAGGGTPSVTGEATAEQRLIALQFAAAAISGVSDPVLILDHELVVQGASKGFCEQFEVLQSSIGGRHFFEITECRWYNEALAAALQGLMNRQAAFDDLEVHCKMPGSGDHLLLMSGRLLDNAAAEPLALVSVADVTPGRTGQNELIVSKHRLEERIKLAVEATGIGTWELNPTAGTLIVDEQARRLFGFTADEPASYENFYGILLDEDKHTRDAALDSARTNNPTGGYEAEYRIHKKDTGELRWIRSKGRLFLDGAQRIVRIVGTLMDITQQKTAREELERIVDERTHSLQDAVDQLQASNNNLEEFAYAASHDLQEPLRKIQTFSKMLEPALSTAGDEKSILYINRIRDASARMSRLIEDLLNYSRLKKTEETQPTDLKDVLTAVISDFDLGIQQKGAEIRVGPLPVVEAAPIHITQLFNNLLSNALKFVKVGGRPVINVDAAPLTDEDRQRYSTLNKRLVYTHITFADNGIGFSPEYADKVFDIFQRLNGRSMYEGTGIGLAICRKIVANLQGIIYAESAEGVGTVFHVLLPVMQ